MNIKKLKKMTVSIPLHSIIDLITNSSTEIFVHSESSIELCKELVNEFLKLMNSSLVCDDIFDLSIEYTSYTVDNYKLRIDWAEKYGDENTQDANKMRQELDDFVQGKISQPEWLEKYHLDNKLIIKPKNKKYMKLALLFKEFLYSGHYFEHSDD